MSDDILTRLKHQWTGEFDTTGELLCRAGEEIERLRKIVNASATAFVLKADEILVIQMPIGATVEECAAITEGMPDFLRFRIVVLRDIELDVRRGV